MRTNTLNSCFNNCRHMFILIFDPSLFNVWVSDFSMLLRNDAPSSRQRIATDKIIALRRFLLRDPQDLVKLVFSQFGTAHVYCALWL